VGCTVPYESVNRSKLEENGFWPMRMLFLLLAARSGAGVVWSELLQRSSGAANPAGNPPSTDDMRILDAKRHLGCVFHLRTPGVSTMIGFSKKIQSSLDGCPASFDSP